MYQVLRMTPGIEQVLCKYCYHHPHSPVTRTGASPSFHICTTEIQLYDH